MIGRCSSVASSAIDSGNSHIEFICAPDPIDARAIADESFKSTNPEDANFRVSELYVALARGQRKIDDVTLPGSGSIAKLASQAQAGDRYYIEIKGVQRKNFKGAVETIPFSMAKNIPLN